METANTLHSGNDIGYQKIKSHILANTLLTFSLGRHKFWSLNIWLHCMVYTYVKSSCHLIPTMDPNEHISAYSCLSMSKPNKTTFSGPPVGKWHTTPPRWGFQSRQSNKQRNKFKGSGTDSKHIHKVSAWGSLPLFTHATGMTTWNILKP